jgi:hypothetical protein
MAAITPVPTAAQFKARFPIFANVTKEVIDAVIVEAMGSVDQSWIEPDQVVALFYLVAHLLVREGHLAASVGAQGAVITRGPVTSVRVGDVSTTYATASSESGGSLGTGSDWLLSTEYGRRFWALRQRSFPAVLVV